MTRSTKIQIGMNVTTAVIQFCLSNVAAGVAFICAAIAWLCVSRGAEKLIAQHREIADLHRSRIFQLERELRNSREVIARN